MWFCPRTRLDKLRNHYGVDASKNLILEAVAKDPQFNKNGKFDRDAFRQFLAQNGFDEDRYVRAVQDEIVGTMIITSVSAASPVDNKLAAEISDLKSLSIDNSTKFNNDSLAELARCPKLRV